MAHIYSKIEAADLVIAEVTEPNPNVMFEAGYARAMGRPMLLIAKQARNGGQPILPYDVRGDRCLFYDDITDLHQQLTTELLKLMPTHINPSRMRKSNRSRRRIAASVAASTDSLTRSRLGAISK